MELYYQVKEQSITVFQNFDLTTFRVHVMVNSYLAVLLSTTVLYLLMELMRY